MINHYRTSLLNISGTNWPGLEYPGEELVDPFFKSKPLKGVLSTVHRMIFGETPDRAYLNYRLRQLTTMWHDGILHEAATAKDSRITYWPLKFASDMTSYGKISVEGVNTDSKPDFNVFGYPTADDARGRSMFIIDATVTGTVCTAIDEFNNSVRTIESSGGFFDFGNNIRAGLGDGHYRIQVAAKPAKDIGQVLVDCEALIGSDVELQLFAKNKDLKELWKRSDLIADKLGALTLALAIELDNSDLIKLVGV